MVKRKEKIRAHRCLYQWTFHNYSATCTTAAQETLYGYLNSRTTSNKMAQTVNVNMKLPEIRRKRFKIVFLVHFILTAFAMMAWAVGNISFPFP